MCGIVGCIAKRNVCNILLEGLRRLEYRGYDSAGLAIINDSLPEPLQIFKVCGKVEALAGELSAANPRGQLGIAHTRWATHGAVTTENAHPHVADDRFAVVHNGIIENFAELKSKLIKKGYKFYSETDSEVIAVSLSDHHKKRDNLLDAIMATVKEMEGAYSLAIIDKEVKDTLIAVRHGAPLVVGIGEEENFLASDPSALLQVTDRFIYLGEEEIAILGQGKVTVQDFKGLARPYEVEVYDHGYSSVERGEYSHYMLKEIYEQPQAINNTISSHIVDKEFEIDFLGTKAVDILKQTKNIYITGCGTSYHAALIARYQFAEYLSMSVLTEVASEFRYMKRVIPPDCLHITISQSGETADILAALNDIKEKRQQIKESQQKHKRKNPSGTLNDESNFLASLAICNVPSSTLVRLCDIPLITAAGPEIGVASTKAFSTQLASLLLLLGMFLHLKGDKKQEKELAKALLKLPKDLKKVFYQRDKIQKMAEKIADYKSAMYIARGPLYPVAMEGALKLKEISYIHAEAYQGGELKHGPLALVDKEFPTVALAQKGKYFSKMKSNMQEVLARGGPLFVFSDSEEKELKPIADDMIRVPESHPLLSPIFFTVAMQILSYETAILLGTDVDQPRNLAKSVTVE